MAKRMILKKRSKSVIRTVGIVMITLIVAGALMVSYVRLASDHGKEIIVFNHTDDELTIRYRSKRVIVKANAYCSILTAAETRAVITVLKDDSERDYVWSPLTNWPYFYRGQIACQMESNGRFYQVPIGETAVVHLFPVKISNECIPITPVNE